MPFGGPFLSKEDLNMFMAPLLQWPSNVCQIEFIKKECGWPAGFRRPRLPSVLPLQLFLTITALLSVSVWTVSGPRAHLNCVGPGGHSNSCLVSWETPCDERLCHSQHQLFLSRHVLVVAWPGHDRLPHILARLELRLRALLACLCCA